MSKVLWTSMVVSNDRASRLSLQNMNKLTRASIRSVFIKRKPLQPSKTAEPASYGAHIDACNQCGNVEISYNSCRNRHCPKCQTISKERWLDARKDELLPVQYFHAVFTVPDDLNPLLSTRINGLCTISFSKFLQKLSKNFLWTKNI